MNLLDKLERLFAEYSGVEGKVALSMIALAAIGFGIEYQLITYNSQSLRALVFTLSVPFAVYTLIRATAKATGENISRIQEFSPMFWLVAASLIAVSGEPLELGYAISIAWILGSVHFSLKNWLSWEPIDKLDASVQLSTWGAVPGLAGTFAIVATANLYGELTGNYPNSDIVLLGAIPAVAAVLYRSWKLYSDELLEVWSETR